jgi:membrane protein
MASRLLYVCPGGGVFHTFRIPITWTELGRRTAREFMADNCLGLAAQLAYYILLALVPALVGLVAVASYVPASVIDQLIATLQSVAPSEISTIVTEQLRKLTESEDGGLLTFGFLFALWSSSAAIVSGIDALNRAYDIEEGRPWWKVRLTAIGITLALTIFLLVAVALVLGGPSAATWMASHFGLGGAFEWTWKIVQWPLVIFLVALGLAFLNYFGPDAEQDWEWITPGSLLSAVLWLLGSLGFKLYVANFGSYNETYGSLGGAIVLMLWFYLSGVVILAGAEVNAEIEHASPHGKAPGEKVPGEKKKLGARAARAYKEEQRKREREHGFVAPGWTPHPSANRLSAHASAAPPAAAAASSPPRLLSLEWLVMAVKASIFLIAFRRRRRSGT